MSSVTLSVEHEGVWVACIVVFYHVPEDEPCLGQCALLMYTFLLNASRRTNYRQANECYVEGFRVELSVDKVLSIVVTSGGFDITIGRNCFYSLGIGAIQAGDLPLDPVAVRKGQVEIEVAITD